MHQKMRKTTIFVLLLAILICYTLPTQSAAIDAFTIQSAINPYFIGVNSFECKLVISNGSSFCVAEASAIQGYTLRSTLALQRSTNKQDWSTYTSWSKDGNVIFQNEYYVPPGYTYRLKLTSKVYTTSGSYITSYTVYSNEVSY